MIRPMQPEDLQEAVALLEILRLHTPYRCVMPEWGLIINTLVTSFAHRDHRALVAEHKGKLTGILIASARPLWWVDQKVGARIVSDLVFYSQRFGDGRAMLKNLVTWAFAQPRVFRIELAVSSGQANLSVMRRVYEREGFSMEGTLFVRNHPKYNEALNGTT